MIVFNRTKSAQGFALPSGTVTLAPGENTVTDAQAAALMDDSTRFGKAFMALVADRKLELERPAFAPARAAPKTIAELRADAEAAARALHAAEEVEAAKADATKAGTDGDKGSKGRGAQK